VRALVQRVSSASVVVDGSTVGSIAGGFLVLLGVHHDDTVEVAAQMADKIANLRVFNDDHGKMNLSLLDAGGEALVVSQFTLYADTRRGRRPSFVDAAAPEVAEPLVRAVIDALAARGIGVASGVFGAHMDVTLVNDGPVTILLELP
jgi:D-tyrosyl-tRNA(Tyr) deacylase